MSISFSKKAAMHLASHFTGTITDYNSRGQLEEALKKTKPGSAPGSDGVTVDFLLLMRAWTTVQLTTLFATSALHVQVSIQYKSLFFFEMYTGKGNPTDMEMYRSILLADVIGKNRGQSPQICLFGGPRRRNLPANTRGSVEESPAWVQKFWRSNCVEKKRRWKAFPLH